ncbi:hypothetical protein CY34DRAFT_735414 [Suillus luteus UH-Slu-Lm8-n1]|uniref:Uncharacterized protein n=1 Tax=Suillus luteus UH-Slu-Lm8-n1 TaxID=930992 RepID=A0A0D0AZB6_9AGAM|nr:hypothetical protein CY34DRAFT_735414 [Suillus luteus UH-Slu-Lm8-n1]
MWSSSAETWDRIHRCIFTGFCNSSIMQQFPAAIEWIRTHLIASCSGWLIFESSTFALWAHMHWICVKCCPIVV